MLARVCLLTTAVLMACGAPAAEPTCQDYCRNVVRCGLDVSERVCMWSCLAGVEHRRNKGSRCSKRHRDELACLAQTDDCEFLLEDGRYDMGDPCFKKGSERSNACNEDDIPADELVPISGFDRSDVAATYMSIDVASEEDAAP